MPPILVGEGVYNFEEMGKKQLPLFLNILEVNIFVNTLGSRHTDSAVEKP